MGGRAGACCGVDGGKLGCVLGGRTGAGDAEGCCVYDCGWAAPYEGLAPLIDGCLGAG
jgi:hypothetical protein